MQQSSSYFSSANLDVNSIIHSEIYFSDSLIILRHNKNERETNNSHITFLFSELRIAFGPYYGVILLQKYSKYPKLKWISILINVTVSMMLMLGCQSKRYCVCQTQRRHVFNPIIIVIPKVFSIFWIYFLYLLFMHHNIQVCFHLVHKQWFFNHF